MIKLEYKKNTVRPKKVFWEKRITKQRRRRSQYIRMHYQLGYTINEQFLILCNGNEKLDKMQLSTNGECFSIGS